MEPDNKFVKSELVVKESPEVVEFAKADLNTELNEEECADRLRKAIEEEKKRAGGLG
jgi:23S rRNA G2069 N7-methylase RlmK/C1962 C5-methylase RlmI